MKAAKIDIDSIISKLLATKGKPSTQVNLTLTELEFICNSARRVFEKQPILLEVQAPVKVCGDIHGQYTDLLKIFEIGLHPPASNYLFLGDYVDRGKQSIECIALLFAYKIKFPDNFFLLRGNHESSTVNKIYGFYDECKRRYNIELWRLFCGCFDFLPVSALIEEHILCMHGGISPELKNLEQIRDLKRPTEVPDKGLICDILWSDPEKSIKGWGENDRGVSVTFGVDVVNKFLNEHNLDLICRAHQVVEDGYEFFADKGLVTLFSAPNYCGEFDNPGVIMNVSSDLVCSFQVLKPTNNCPRRSKLNSKM